MVPPSNVFLARYFAGECSTDEIAEFLRWVGEDSARPGWLGSLDKAWRARRPSPSWDVDGMWRAVERSTRAERGAVARRRPLFQQWSGARRGPAIAAAVAAIVATTALGTAGLRFFQDRAAGASASVPMRSYTTARGQRATLQLPDGSRLVLAPESRLRIPATFGRAAREVLLDGEAVFDVVHDTTRPFRVIAKYAVAQDIGTRFGVRAYPEDSAVTVAVETGAVALGSADVPGAGTAQGVVLTAGELGTLGRAGLVTTARGPAAADYLAWARGRLVLTDVPLGEAVARLGRWYGADIRLASPAMSIRRVTAAFDGESALEALQFIASFLDLTVVQAGNRYTLRSK